MSLNSSKIEGELLGGAGPKAQLHTYEGLGEAQARAVVNFHFAVGKVSYLVFPVISYRF